MVDLNGAVAVAPPAAIVDEVDTGTTRMSDTAAETRIAASPERPVLRQEQGTVSVRTRGQGLYDVTPFVRGWLVGKDISTGLLTVFCRHTSASLIVQENADADVQRDLLTFFRRLVQEDRGLYRHLTEGPDDMPAHIRSALTLTQLSIPIGSGQLTLGTWQAIYLFEHRSGPQNRELALHVIGA